MKGTETTRYGRKFIAFLLSLFIYTGIMIIAIFFSSIQDLGMFSMLLAASVMQISGAYYAGNVLSKKGTDGTTNKQP